MEQLEQTTPAKRPCINQNQKPIQHKQQKCDKQLTGQNTTVTANVKSTPKQPKEPASALETSTKLRQQNKTAATFIKITSATSNRKQKPMSRKLKHKQPKETATTERAMLLWTRLIQLGRKLKLQE